MDAAEKLYGNRADGTAKGRGYFGEIKRPDGGVSTEVSVGVEIDGKEVEIPLIVPTLTKTELDKLLKLDPGKKEFFDQLPRTVMDKAVQHARSRMKSGLSPFAGPNESAPIPQGDTLLTR